MKKNFIITLLRPAGNDTALVEGFVKKTKRRVVGEKIMQMYPNVEQVGFYKLNEDNTQAQLIMAGGEFCGNATRALAYLALKGKIGQITIKASGTKQFLQAGVKKKNTAFAQMPIKKSFLSIKQFTNYSLVNLKGISHLIVKKTENTDREKLKRKAKKLLKRSGLLYSRHAAGVMFTTEQKNYFDLEPVVWVRDIETLFYETACASGTTALGLWILKQSNKKKIILRVKQPSKQTISITASKTDKLFTYARIDGPIAILKQEKIKLVL